jgi:hypothetical protein
MPELIECCVCDYEYWRNRRRTTSTSAEQEEYKVDRNLYGEDFWEAVIKEHFDHRLNFNNTFSFLSKVTGQCVTWPSMCIQIPYMIRNDDSLRGRFDHAAQNHCNNVLGYFDFCRNTDDEIDKVLTEIQQGLHKSDSNKVCALLIDYKNIDLLVKHPVGRNGMAVWLAKLMSGKNREQVEDKLGSRMKQSLNHISSL